MCIILFCGSLSIKRWELLLTYFNFFPLHIPVLYFSFNPLSHFVIINDPFLLSASLHLSTFYLRVYIFLRLHIIYIYLIFCHKFPMYEYFLKHLFLFLSFKLVFIFYFSFCDSPEPPFHLTWKKAAVNIKPASLRQDGSSGTTLHIRMKLAQNLCSVRKCTLRRLVKISEMWSTGSFISRSQTFDYFSQ